MRLLFVPQRPCYQIIIIFFTSVNTNQFEVKGLYNFIFLGIHISEDALAHKWSTAEDALSDEAEGNQTAVSTSLTYTRAPYSAHEQRRGGLQQRVLNTAQHIKGAALDLDTCQRDLQHH